MLTIPTAVSAQSWEVRRELRQGGREVVRERREARREIRREVREDYFDSDYRGNNRWYRDGRYRDRRDYERRYYYRRDDDGGDVFKGALWARRWLA